MSRHERRSNAVRTLSQEPTHLHAVATPAREIMDLERELQNKGGGARPRARVEDERFAKKGGIPPTCEFQLDPSPSAHAR